MCPKTLYIYIYIYLKREREKEVEKKNTCLSPLPDGKEKYIKSSRCLFASAGCLCTEPSWQRITSSKLRQYATESSGGKGKLYLFSNFKGKIYIQTDIRRPETNGDALTRRLMFVWTRVIVWFGSWNFAVPAKNNNKKNKGIKYDVRTLHKIILVHKIQNICIDILYSYSFLAR